VGRSLAYAVALLAASCVFAVGTECELQPRGVVQFGLAADGAVDCPEGHVDRQCIEPGLAWACWRADGTLDLRGRIYPLPLVEPGACLEGWLPHMENMYQRREGASGWVGPSTREPPLVNEPCTSIAPLELADEIQECPASFP